MNLCLNARDAMPKGGQLTIDVSNATLDGRRRAPMGQIGGSMFACALPTPVAEWISPTLARIYEPFFTTKPKDKGSRPRAVDRLSALVERPQRRHSRA